MESKLTDFISWFLPHCLACWMACFFYSRILLGVFLSIKPEQHRIGQKRNCIKLSESKSRLETLSVLVLQYSDAQKLITKPGIPYVTSIYTKTSTDGSRQACLPSTCNNEGVKPTEICIFCET